MITKEKVVVYIFTCLFIFFPLDLLLFILTLEKPTNYLNNFVCFFVCLFTTRIYPLLKQGYLY